LYDAAGPKKKIDYSKPNIDDGDFVMYDQDEEEKVQTGEDGSYRVTHQGEKFAIFPGN